MSYNESTIATDSQIPINYTTRTTENELPITTTNEPMLTPTFTSNATSKPTLQSTSTPTFQPIPKRNKISTGFLILGGLMVLNLLKR